MKKMINIRNSVIIIMAVTVIFLVIGFIILSMELKKQNDERQWPKQKRFLKFWFSYDLVVSQAFAFFVHDRDSLTVF